MSDYDNFVKRMGSFDMELTLEDIAPKNNELAHHGILGMKWGVRRYQNKNGTLTNSGKKRYSIREARANRKQREKDNYENARKAGDKLNDSLLQVTKNPSAKNKSAYKADKSAYRESLKNVSRNNYKRRNRQVLDFQRTNRYRSMRKMAIKNAEKGSTEIKRLKRQRAGDVARYAVGGALVANYLSGGKLGKMVINRGQKTAKSVKNYFDPRVLEKGKGYVELIDLRIPSKISR